MVKKEFATGRALIFKFKEHFTDQGSYDLFVGIIGLGSFNVMGPSFDPDNSFAEINGSSIEIHRLIINGTGLSNPCSQKKLDEHEIAKLFPHVDTYFWDGLRRKVFFTFLHSFDSSGP